MSRLLESSLTGKISNILVEEENKEKFCPRCGKFYKDYPAISRYDNETEICPDCGVDEAMIQYTGGKLESPTAFKDNFKASVEKHEKEVDECDKVIKESFEDSIDIIADFMIDYSPEEFRSTCNGDKEVLKNEIRAFGKYNMKDYFNQIIDYEEGSDEQIEKAKELIKLCEEDEVRPEDLENDDKEIIKNKIKELEDRLGEILVLEKEPGLDVYDVADYAMEKADLYGRLDELNNELYELTKGNINESAEGVAEFWEKGINVGDKVDASFGEVEILDVDKDNNYILIKRETDYDPYVAAWAPEYSDGKLVWGQGHYFNDLDSAKKYFSKLNESCKSKALKEDSYDKGIYKEIEDALVDAGFSVDRYIDTGVLTKNIGWEVSKDGKFTQLDCPGSWYDEDEEYDESSLKEAHTISAEGGKFEDCVFDKEDAEYFQNLVGSGIKVALENRGETENTFMTFTPESKWVSGFHTSTKELDNEIDKYFAEKYPEFKVYRNNTGTTLWLGKKEDKKDLDESVTVITADGSSVVTDNAAAVEADSDCTIVATDNTTVTICNNVTEEPANELASEGEIDAVVEPTEEIVSDEEVAEVEEPVETEVVEEADEVDNNIVIKYNDLTVVKNQGNVYMLRFEDENGKEFYVVCENFDANNKSGDELEQYDNKEEADKDYFERLDVNTEE